MRGETIRRQRVSAGELARLRGRLSGRDLAIIGQVADLRLMSARQIQAIHFPGEEHESERAATHARQRVLAKLAREQLLTRLERRIGGVRAGSAGFVFALGPVGQRLLAQDTRRVRAYEPTSRFVEHTLAISQLVVDVTLAARRNELELLRCQSEPRCWRPFSPLSRLTLRPDLYLAIAANGYELHWFCEIDRASESIPTLIKQCRQYHDYYQTGKEQAQNNGIFPRVCWIVPDDHRAERLRDALARRRELPDRLFVITTSAQALRSLKGEAR